MGQQVGLVGNRTDHRQDAADGGRLLRQVFDHLGVALHLADQRMQAGQAHANDFLALFHRQAGAAAGVRRLAGIAADLLDGRFQFAQGIADLSGVTGLAFGPVVQGAAQVGEGAAAVGHLFGVLPDGAYQVHQVGPQTVQRSLDIVQLAIGLAQLDVPTEVAFGPGRKSRSEVGQYPGQFALQGIDQQSDQQDQTDHRALHQAHFALDLAVLGADQRLQRGDRGSGRGYGPTPPGNVSAGCAVRV